MSINSWISDALVSSPYLLATLGLLHYILFSTQCELFFTSRITFLTHFLMFFCRLIFHFSTFVFHSLDWSVFWLFGSSDSFAWCGVVLFFINIHRLGVSLLTDYDTTPIQPPSLASFVDTYFDTIVFANNNKVHYTLLLFGFCVNLIYSYLFIKSCYPYEQVYYVFFPKTMKNNSYLLW